MALRPLEGLRLGLLLTLLGSTLFVTPALAAVSPTRNAADIAGAVAVDPSTVGAASFDALPPSGSPVATSDSLLTGFPTHGSSYGILTTGNATFADNLNTAGDDGENDGGGNVPGRGGNDFDVTVLRLGLNVPAGTNCLSVDFQFFTEEYPENVGSRVNDAFIAELDGSSWTTSVGGGITAPENFAFDPAGREISVNASGETSMTQSNASGTTYDGATPLLRASKSVSPGSHTLFLSIFDQGDAILDSASFVDNLVFSNEPQSGCVSGARRAPDPGGPARLADLPAPKLGKTVNVEAVSGRVRVGVRGRGGSGSARASQKGVPFVPLSEARQIPVGSFLDTRRGTVRLVSARSSSRSTQTGDFSTGLFQVLQSRRRSARGLTDLVLKGGSFRRCLSVGLDLEPASLSSRGSRDVAMSARRIRRLSSNARGRFRTRGRHSAATVRGTKWTTTDRCDGTLTKVTRGKVVVRDFRLKRNLLVRAGKSYLARTRR